MAEFWIDLAFLAAGCALGVLVMCLMVVAGGPDRDQEARSEHEESISELFEASSDILASADTPPPDQIAAALAVQTAGTSDATALSRVSKSGASG